MVQFNNKKLITILVGGALVILGVHLKNGSEQAGIQASAYGMGALSFLAGWVTVAFGLGLSDLAIAGSVSVVIAVMSKKAAKDDPGSFLCKLSPFSGPLFIGGWVLVALSAVKDLKLGDLLTFRTSRAALTAGGTVRGQLAFAAFAGVMASMLYFLPIERRMKITDTIGMPIFTASWFALAMAHAMK